MSNRMLVSAIAAVVTCAAPSYAQQAQQAQQAAQDFPDGPGKQLLTTTCNTCHPANRVQAGYSPEGWRTVIRMMLNFEVPIPEDQVGPLTEYLIKNFPEKPRPAAVIVDGPANASIKQWSVPTPGS